VLTRTPRRRRWSADEKSAIVAERPTDRPDRPDRPTTTISR
jgi:hypothetical protein